MTKESLNSRIRFIRDYLKRNQIDFSAEIGMSQSEYSKIELGKVKPSRTVLYAMMAQFAINPDWITTGEGEMFLSAEEYLNNGIRLLGKEKIAQQLIKLCNDPQFLELQEMMAVGNGKGDLDPKLEAYLQYIIKKWRQGDQAVQSWLLIQLSIAFREVVEENKEKGLE